MAVRALDEVNVVPAGRIAEVVSIFSTSSPQLDILGWQLAQEARVFWVWRSWQARQLMPSCTPMGVRSSPEPTWKLASGAWHW
jgi:hypothetical protein